MFQTVCIDWFKNKKLHIHTSTLGTPLPLSFSFSSLDSFWAVTFIVENGSFPNRELTFRPCKDHLHLKRLLCFFFFACFRLKENIFIVTICNSVLHFTFYRAPDVFEMEISFFLSGFFFFQMLLNELCTGWHRLVFRFYTLCYFRLTRVASSTWSVVENFMFILGLVQIWLLYVRKCVLDRMCDCVPAATWNHIT